MALHHLVTGRPLTDQLPGTELAMLGMGCFWGAERIFWSMPGVETTFAAYAGGHVANPTYGQVCTGTTGHAECVGIAFDPETVDYEQLLAAFWENHDPTQGMRQGNDIGPQYRSIILVTSESQREIAEHSRTRYQHALDAVGEGAITTEIVALGDWWLAEPEHQQYLARYPQGYCNHGFCQVAYSA
jgi:peptide-methionine (S)-S-oxide reductase